MLYSLLDTKTNLFYNYKNWNNRGGSWVDKWWYSYKYHKIEKAKKHKAILEKNGFNIKIEPHTKEELTKIPIEKWKRQNQ